MIDDEWSVVVFKCPPEQTKKHLIDFYRYTEYLVGVKSVHFLIRDRLDDEVVVSFRILLSLEGKNTCRRGNYPSGSALLSRRDVCT